jgi:hypothetical protein
MNLRVFNRQVVIAAALIAGFIAAGESRAADPNPSAIDKKYLLEKQPDKASDVVAIRKDAKDQEDIVVVGRVGGRKNPWVKGLAAFSIVDRSLKACSELPGDTCPTPWDFCCATDVPKSTLLVLVQDADGKPVKKDARELLGLKELDTVFIQGKAKRDKAGNVSILASKVYVASDKKEAAK